jgi:hypothetical protein
VLVAGLEVDATPAARPARVVGRVNQPRPGDDHVRGRRDAGLDLGAAASMVTLALKSALFPKNMLSTRLPAALR